MSPRDKIFDQILAKQKTPKQRVPEGKYDQDEFWRWKFATHKERAMEYINEFRITGKTVIPEVYLGYVDSPILNAFAITPTINDPYIGINSGTILLIIDFFYRAMSHPQVFPAVGTPGAESIRDCHKEGIHRNFDDVLKLRPKGIADSKPCDPTRHLFADFMAAIAFDFLMVHEMAHIRNGHCELSRRLRKGCPLYEATSVETVKTHMLTVQAMEYDADIHAACTGFTDYFKQRPGPVRTDAGIISEWVVAISCLMYLLGCRFSPSKLAYLSHPPPSSRLGLIGGGMSVQVITRELGANAVEGFKKIFYEARNIAKGVFEIFGESVNTQLQEIHRIGGPSLVLDHELAIIKRWKEVRPRFMKFGYD